MSEAVQEEITIAAEPSAVMAVITDVGAYPEWQDEMRSAEVLDTDDQGRPTHARLSVDAKLFTATYVLAYAYTETVASWELEHSDQLSELRGSYALTPTDQGHTHVVYDLTVTPKLPVPGLLRRKASRRIADSALKGLKARVERGS